ncbi:hypothetical protein GCM10023201_50370 [Actinomycetospora corticicola]
MPETRRKEVLEPWVKDYAAQVVAQAPPMTPALIARLKAIPGTLSPRPVAT